MFSKLRLMVKALMLKSLDRILVNDLYMAYHGTDFYFTLWELDQFLRTITKYNPDDLSEDVVDMADKVRDKIYDLMNDNDVDFNHVD